MSCYNRLSTFAVVIKATEDQSESWKVSSDQSQAIHESISLSFAMDRRRGCQIPLHYSSSSSSSCLPSQPPLVQPSSMAMSPFHDDQEYRYSGRVRMRKWLINQVSSGRYIGLKWIDKDKTLLRIPWKHGSRSGWSVEDGKLFESWAVQSGWLLFILLSSLEIAVSLILYLMFPTQ